MLDILSKIIEELCSSTEYYIPILFLMLAFLSIVEINKKAGKLPGYMFISLTLLCFEGFILYVILGIHKIRIGGLLIGILMIVTVLYALINYIRVERSLKRVIRYSDEERFDANLVEAWNLTYDLKPSVMTGRQLNKYNRYRIFLRAKLGCFHANEVTLKEFEDGSSSQKAFYHFIRYIQYQAMGCMEKAYDHIKKAEDLSNGDLDKTLRSQILINRGVAYAQHGMYQDADDAFVRAINFCDKHRIKSSYLWNVLYSNYAFNKTCLDNKDSVDELDSIMKQLENHLDMDKPSDYIGYFNTRLELLRQFELNRSRLDELVHKAFDYVQNSNIPDLNRCAFEASTARIIWSAQLDPAYILEALSRDMDLLSQLPMPARYNGFKNIELFFGDLHGSIVSKHENLKRRAIEYMQNQAESDLNEYRKSLPSEAVYERYFCFYELAGIQKRNPEKYKWSVVANYFKNASALYHENGLIIDEIMCKLAFVDEASGVLNCDEHLNLVRKSEMLQLMDEVEALLPQLESHPVINEIALRMSFYCMALDDYTRGRKYFELYKSTSRQISINHYAPWLHRYYMDVVFTVRVLYIVDCVHKIIAELDTFDLSGLARTWFKEFDNNGVVVHLVIGLLIGFKDTVILKQSALLDVHEWLNFREIGLEIDVLQTDKIFYHPGQHPLEKGRSVNNVVIALENFNKEQQAALKEVCDVISDNLPAECPKISELQAAFDDVMLPVFASDREENEIFD